MVLLCLLPMLLCLLSSGLSMRQVLFRGIRKAAVAASTPTQWCGDIDPTEAVKEEQLKNGENCIAASFLRGLNEEQRAAVTAPLADVRVVAGPGSGKTRVLISRILYLVETMGVPPRQILAVTFTKKASAEMLSRVKKYYETESVENITHGGSSVDRAIATRSSEVPSRRAFTLTTLHSFCAYLLRLDARHNGGISGTASKKGFSIFDEGDSVKVVNRLLKAKDLLKVYKSRQVLQYISILKREGFSYRSMKEDLFQKGSVFAKLKDSASTFKENIASLFIEYNSILKENNALDFDDIILEALHLVRANGYVAKYATDRFRHILVDEFQDIDNVQNELLLLLRGDAVDKSLFVVGDPDQTIYSWRGASPRFMAAFTDNFNCSCSYALIQNYRSTRDIIRASRHFISKGAADTHSSINRGPGLVGEFVNEGSVRIVNTYNDGAQAEYIAHMVAYLLASGEVTDASDIAVMYRKHSLSLAVETAFLSRALPYTIVDDLAVTDRKEVRDALAYLRLMTNPRDIESMKRVINYPPRGVGAATQQKLFDFVDNIMADTVSATESSGRGGGYKSSLPPILDLLLCLGGLSDDSDILLNANDGDSAKKMGFIRELVESEDFSNKQLKSLKVASDAFYELEQAVATWEGSMEELVTAIFTKSGLIRYIADKAKSEKEKSSRLSNLFALVELARRFDLDLGSYADPEDLLLSSESAFSGLERLKMCLDSLVLSSDNAVAAGENDGSAAAGGAVKLLSLHASKGLEFKVVFIVGMEEGVLPSIAALNSGIFRTKKKKKSSKKVKTDEDGDSDSDSSIEDITSSDDDDDSSFIDSDIEEERRLMYVGLTRARERLFLTYRTRFSIDAKRSTAAQPSSFLAQLPPDTLYEVYVNKRQ